MPGWSPEIANEFIRLGMQNGRTFDQMQLQKLIYIAHGWHLAFFKQPLTGDRPEAWSFGPVYRRLADALASYGEEQITRPIRVGDFDPECPASKRGLPAQIDLDRAEMDTIVMVHKDFGEFDASRLAVLTQAAETPWARVFGDGAGEHRDISHELIRAQFVELARKSGDSEPSS